MNKNKYSATVCILFTLLGTFTLPAYAADLNVAYKNGACTAYIDGDEYQCALGRSGLTSDKVEGDGTTPIGVFPLRDVLYRADRISKEELQDVSLPLQEIKPTDGWCDAPSSKFYNKLVDLKSFDSKVSHEKLYRDDDLYNIVIVVGYNDAPAVPNKGSAVFIRVSAPDYAGTPGGIVFSQEDLLKILTKLDSKSKLSVNYSI